jgi:hypothetical protein
MMALTFERLDQAAIHGSLYLPMAVRAQAHMLNALHHATIGPSGLVGTSGRERRCKPHYEGTATVYRERESATKSSPIELPAANDYQSLHDGAKGKIQFRVSDSLRAKTAAGYSRKSVRRLRSKCRRCAMPKPKRSCSARGARQYFSPRPAYGQKLRECIELMLFHMARSRRPGVARWIETATAPRLSGKPRVMANGEETRVHDYPQAPC